MAGNPLIPQGTLNRLRATVIVPDNPSLNVLPSFLGIAGVSLTFADVATRRIRTMAGIVTSPVPYQETTCQINLLKSQNLAQLWETQRQTLSTIGDITVTTDASTLASYLLYNSSIENVAPLSFAGEDAGYVVTVGGYILTNNSLWDLV